MTNTSSIIAGISVSVAGFVAKTLGQTAEVLPEWMDRYGLPGAVIAGMSYACLHLWRDGRTQREDRIKDRDTFIAKMEVRDAAQRQFYFEPMEVLYP